LCKCHSVSDAPSGDMCFTRPAIHVLCKKFAYGHESVVDEERPCRRLVSTTDATVAAVSSLVQSDWCVMSNFQMNLNDILKNETLTFDV